ncbi:MAG: ATP synthase F0 subunit B [Actinobacteria bacterium]|nr:MAG: ATP synthase F0 subunit B [Actinomycetota bacterium]
MELLPDPAQVIYSTIAFFVLLALLWRFAFPPVVGMLDKRQATIKESLERAEETRVEAQRLLAEYKKQLAEARAEAQAITEQGRKVGESMKEDIVTKARQEATALIAKATEEIAAEKRKALDEVTERVAGLTVAAAERVVAKALDEADHKRLIEEYVAEIGK